MCIRDRGWVVSPVGAGRLLEAEKGARLLVDPSLAAQVVSGVLHILFDYTTWKRSKGLSSPENPDPSAASVAVSNSREVGSGTGLSPVT